MTPARDTRAAPPGPGPGDGAGGPGRGPGRGDRAREAPGRPGGPPPGVAPTRTRGARPWWRRLRWRRVLLIFAVLVVLGLIGGDLLGRRVGERIDRVEGGGG